MSERMDTKSSASRMRRLDYHKTAMQERGYCRVATLSFAQVAEIVNDLGLDPDDCFIDVAGWLYSKKAASSAVSRPAHTESE